MIDFIFNTLQGIDDFYWSYIGFLIVILSGLYISFKCKGFQFRVLSNPRKTFRELQESSSQQQRGTNPFKLYFASIGGMIGLGNIVAVITAMMVGGPGALLWLWVAGFFGMIIKYSEIYLGVRFRVKNEQGGYDGGPMYYLQRAFSNAFLKKSVPIAVSILLCIYGVEVYQFVIIVDTVTNLVAVDRLWVVLLLIAMTIYTAFGGVKRLANICSLLMPFFMVVYVGMCLWVIGSHISALPSLLVEVLQSAFTGSAAMGGFAGSTMLLAAQQGISRAVYSCDIAIGYDSIVQSETKSLHPERQARLAIFGVLGDLIFSTVGMLVVLTTGLLWQAEGLKASQYVAHALGTVFPYVQIFMGGFIFLAGWTTIVGYLVVGTKCARYLSPRYGFAAYIAYAVLAFVTFSYMEQEQVLLIMSLSGGLLLMFNVTGLLKLRREIRFQ